MKLSDFSHFIREMPVQYQSFEVKRDQWQFGLRKDIIASIFETHDTISISRSDIFKTENDMERLIIMTLMWGYVYPSRGRGNNIKNLLNVEWGNLCSILPKYQKKEISIETMKKDIQGINGLGLSTMTKFTYFLGTKICGFESLILDRVIINTIKRSRFSDFDQISNINENRPIDTYEDYIKLMHQISKRINCRPDQLEMFLFTFGNNLTSI